jgi:HK97 gp10 family phage protein
MAGFEMMYDFAGRLRDFPVQARPLIKAAMDEAGQEGEDYSKSLVPVRTGNLQRSIVFHATTDHGWTFLLKAEVGEEYATFVEYGTSRMPPQPFFEPGVELAADRMEDLLGTMVVKFL